MQSHRSIESFTPGCSMREEDVICAVKQVCRKMRCEAPVSRLVQHCTDALSDWRNCHFLPRFGTRKIPIVPLIPFFKFLAGRRMRRRIQSRAGAGKDLASNLASAEDLPLVVHSSKLVGPFASLTGYNVVPTGSGRFEGLTLRMESVRRHPMCLPSCSP